MFHLPSLFYQHFLIMGEENHITRIFLSEKLKAISIFDKRINSVHAGNADFRKPSAVSSLT